MTEQPFRRTRNRLSLIFDELTFAEQQEHFIQS
jgi:hypothetical protein